MLVSFFFTEKPLDIVVSRKVNLHNSHVHENEMRKFWGGE